MDTYEMIKWGQHEDARFLHYNFPYRRHMDLQHWFGVKKQLLRRWIYAIESDGTVQGYITLKNVNWLKGIGEMGIALNPDRLGERLGTIGICLYLHRVFRSFPLKKIELKAAEFNERALKCYEKVGFTRVKTVREVFEEQSTRDEILAAFPNFDHDDKNLYVNYVYMEITKEDYLRRYTQRVSE